MEKQQFFLEVGKLFLSFFFFVTDHVSFAVRTSQLTGGLGIFVKTRSPLAGLEDLAVTVWSVFGFDQKITLNIFPFHSNVTFLAKKNEKAFQIPRVFAGALSFF